MRKLITAALLAASALAPAAAQAQSRGELRRDRQEIREERRDVRDARRFGDRRDVRGERRDLRAARQEYREDLRDRRGDRRFYHQSRRGNWRAPFGYSVFRPGVRIGQPFYQQRYWISDPYRYNLPRVVGFQRWVRHYDDLLLVDTRRGVVLDVLRNYYW
jgi:Ni/Co efflux regulator RcnB